MNKFSTILFVITFLISCQVNEGEYVCTPCNLPCDNLIFEKPGICPHCQMKLIKRSDLIDESNLILNDVTLNMGSGVFLIEGLSGEEHKTIKVYYHKPLNFSNNSKILIVVPGAGRDGDEYRDAWKENSEKYNVLVLSPMFEEAKYSFEDYHLCGLVSELNIEQAFNYIQGTNQVNLNEDIISFKLNLDNRKWIFNHFDRIFNLVVESEKSKQTDYNIFGHSAGGQILHRMALVDENSKAAKIIAANSGFYTMPELDVKLPFGISGLNLNAEYMAKSFAKNLIILVGEMDNENETQGTLLRSSIADKQGLHRLARAKYFYNFSKSYAKKLGVDFKWDLKIVKDIGHNQMQMGNEAAKLLYE